MSATDSLRILARIFAAPLGREEVETIARADHELSEALRQDGAREDVARLAEVLAEEYTRLFVGPVGHHPPLAGLMRGDEELLGPFARAVTQAYRESGLEADPASAVLPDHLSVQLDFLATLVERGRVVEAAQFVARYMDTWVPAWVGGYSSAARKAFYRVAGSLLLEALRDLRGVDDASTRGASATRHS